MARFDHLFDGAVARPELVGLLVDEARFRAGVSKVRIFDEATRTAYLSFERDRLNLLVRDGVVQRAAMF